MKSIGGALVLMAGCASRPDPLLEELSTLLAEDRADFARERCFELLRADPRHPVARRLLWPVLERVEDDARQSAIHWHGTGAAFRYNDPETSLSYQFLRSCRLHQDRDWPAARLGFQEVPRRTGSFVYEPVLHAEAALRLEEINARRLPPS